MVRDTLQALIPQGLPVITTALGTMWAYDKKNSLKWGALGGAAGFIIGFVAKDLVLRLVDRVQPLPKEVVRPAEVPVLERAPVAAPEEPQTPNKVVQMHPPIPKGAIGLKDRERP